MYLLVGVWGGRGPHLAAVKFFLYTLVGSLLMLVAILALYSPQRVGRQRRLHRSTLTRPLRGFARSPTRGCRHSGVFAAFALAFAIKVPMWPVHTWLPDAHVQAPVAGSMILAGVMLKMGTFGFWRFAIPLFPAAAELRAARHRAWR